MSPPSARRAAAGLGAAQGCIEWSCMQATMLSRVARPGERLPAHIELSASGCRVCKPSPGATAASSQPLCHSPRSARGILLLGLTNLAWVALWFCCAGFSSLFQRSYGDHTAHGDVRRGRGRVVWRPLCEQRAVLGWGARASGSVLRVRRVSNTLIGALGTWLVLGHCVSVCSSAGVH